MSDAKVASLLHDLALLDVERLAVVEAVRTLIYSLLPSATERVMYGGLLFATQADFCGIFAYQKHVSVEFGRGCDLSDVAGVLEGGGKFRRHIKLFSLKDIEDKSLAQYIVQAEKIA
ncbi:MULTISPECIES: DUF1801 domain-containing protein [Deefgea]|uniref:DUF1801 domain-containing protein n=1 Tax=Deefgea chitinilytica TaxID=570276 RepID=A0ABS2CDC7_9NEIS|nr:MULTISPECIES: DUF1801 domain-containing protein [Deefgea]MBM5572162.1 DUF1801 domain-containing protein [Deefgea chitinilytica]MBM9889397.1 DUF1801 domain-containing protein [Deefgea sp. CFH1-16]